MTEEENKLKKSVYNEVVYNKQSEKIENVKYINPIYNDIKLIIPEFGKQFEYLKERSKPFKQIIENLNVSIKPLFEAMRNCINYYTPYFYELSQTIGKLEKNPDSILNWYEYSKKMSEFFWIIPYKIKLAEMKEIVKTVNSEEEFDIYISKYFTKELLIELEEEIYNNLPNKHKLLFKQIIKAFDMKSYALANTGIMSIIDGLCSYYISDKGCLKRVGIFKPIINDLEEKLELKQIIFILLMLDNNIAVLYENIDFNNEISINTNKKVRRNPNQHGQAYSNKKIDAIMLLNTLYYLVITQKELEEYKNKLYYNRQDKKFYINKK